MAEEGKKRSVRRRNPSVNLDTLGLEMGNIPPQALDVEEAVLGALLIEPHCVDEAMDELSPSCFYSEKHRMIFEAMSSLNNEHVALDLLSYHRPRRRKRQGRVPSSAQVKAQIIFSLCCPPVKICMTVSGFSYTCCQPKSQS